MVAKYPYAGMALASVPNEWEKQTEIVIDIRNKFQLDSWVFLTSSVSAMCNCMAFRIRLMVSVGDRQNVVSNANSNEINRYWIICYMQILSSKTTFCAYAVRRTWLTCEQSVSMHVYSNKSTKVHWNSHSHTHTHTHLFARTEIVRLQFCSRKVQNRNVCQLNIHVTSNCAHTLSVCCCLVTRRMSAVCVRTRPPLCQCHARAPCLPATTQRANAYVEATQGAASANDMQFKWFCLLLWRQFDKLLYSNDAVRTQRRAIPRSNAQPHTHTHNIAWESLPGQTESLPYEPNAGGRTHAAVAHWHMCTIIIWYN